MLMTVWGEPILRLVSRKRNESKAKGKSIQVSWFLLLRLVMGTWWFFSRGVPISRPIS
jgi:hypothetical protein